MHLSVCHLNTDLGRHWNDKLAGTALRLLTLFGVTYEQASDTVTAHMRHFVLYFVYGLESNDAMSH
jgi:hypothetical protein